MIDNFYMTWWAWVGFGLILGILEIILPFYMFLGFGIGAIVTGICLFLGLSTGLPTLLVIFAISSLIAWLTLRRIFRLRRGDVKKFDYDVNDN